jgi:soluble lytic murein transglycosylase-like protein
MERSWGAAGPKPDFVEDEFPEAPRGEGLRGAARRMLLKVGNHGMARAIIDEMKQVTPDPQTSFGDFFEKADAYANRDKPSLSEYLASSRIGSTMRDFGESLGRESGAVNALVREGIQRPTEEATVVKAVPRSKPPKTQATRTRRYNEAHIKGAAEAHKIDPHLLAAVAAVESSWDPKAKGTSGEIGLMQLMPETAKELGVTDPEDPSQSLLGGARYIAKLLKRNNGDIEMALTEYNWGMGNMKKNGFSQRPKSTREYVKKVMQKMDTYER